MIPERQLKILEFDQVLERLAQEAESKPGKRRCLELRPDFEQEAIESRLDDTNDMLRYLYEEGSLPFSAYEDQAELIRYCQAGAVPSLASFLRVARSLRLVAQLKSHIPADPEELKRPLYVRLSALTALPDLEAAISRSILNEDELYDQASPELYRLRQQISREQEEIKANLASILKKQGTALQDQVVTMRADRYVLPVKSEHKGTVPGIVHDTSSSGQTFFIEPLAVVERNNKIRELKIREQKEIERILQVLASELAASASELLSNADTLTELDFIQAKARLAKQQKASRPLLNQERRVYLKKARHPLIPPQQVVPIDFELGRSFDTLVITGPNTGGKTVSLKTCGLLTLMAMSGLLIPAAENSEIALFTRILADIGDEQSIEQNLSTFSAHIRQIVEICRVADPDSLILLDELGAGTDPSEGAALAVAILDYLRRQGASLVATTHYQEIKAYALNTSGVSNACCEFDTQSLRPTYKLLIGVPGVSNALAISTRLGLQPEIIAAARELISDEGARFEDLVQAIEQSHREAKALESELELLKQEGLAQKAQLEAERTSLKQEKAKLLAEAEAKAAEILDEAQLEVELILEDIQRQLQENDAEAARKTALSMRNELQKERRKRQEKRQKADLKAKISKPLGQHEIVIGQSYLAPTLGISGEAASLPDAKGLVLLKQGAVQVKVPLAALQLQENVQKKASAPANNIRQISQQARLSVHAELMLLGLKVDEALERLDHYLDEATLGGLHSVRIVHGKGTGALRKAVQERLRRDRRVKSFEQAAFGQGDAGVTIVELR